MNSVFHDDCFLELNLSKVKYKAVNCTWKKYAKQLVRQLERSFLKPTTEFNNNDLTGSSYCKGKRL